MPPRSTYLLTYYLLSYRFLVKDIFIAFNFYFENVLKVIIVVKKFHFHTFSYKSFTFIHRINPNPVDRHNYE